MLQIILGLWYGKFFQTPHIPSSIIFRCIKKGTFDLEEKKKWLIANRGEISLRIIRRFKNLDIQQIPHTKLRAAPHTIFVSQIKRVGQEMALQWLFSSRRKTPSFARFLRWINMLILSSNRSACSHCPLYSSGMVFSWFVRRISNYSKWQKYVPKKRSW